MSTAVKIAMEKAGIVGSVVLDPKAITATLGKFGVFDALDAADAALAVYRDAEKITQHSKFLDANILEAKNGFTGSPEYKAVLAQRGERAEALKGMAIRTQVLDDIDARLRQALDDHIAPYVAQKAAYATEHDVEGSFKIVRESHK